MRRLSTNRVRVWRTCVIVFSSMMKCVFDSPVVAVKLTLLWIFVTLKRLIGVKLSVCGLF